MIIRKVSKSEYSDLVVVHKVAFSDFFLTSLGTSFLKTYYKSSLLDQTCVAFGAFNDEDKMVGFVVGTTKALGYHKKLLVNNLLPFAISLLGVIAYRPKVILRLLKNLEKKSSPIDDKNYAELLSLAVLPEMKGSGVAKLLLEQFEREVNSCGVKSVALTTDYDNNERAIAFYTKCNYKIMYDFIAYPNRKMLKMIRHF
jgi:ribosomal protein S18 acetylase RimI-like enzyme